MAFLLYNTVLNIVFVCVPLRAETVTLDGLVMAVIVWIKLQYQFISLSEANSTVVRVPQSETNE